MAAQGSFVGQAYGSQGYWDRRYASSRAGACVFEWYSVSCATLAPLVAPLRAFANGGFALEMGCGNSGLAEELAEFGFERIVAIDFSEEVISQRRKASASGGRVHYAVADARHVPPQCLAHFGGGSACMLVVDKALLDATDCADGDEGDESSSISGEVAVEMARVLAPGGIALIITCRPPERRLRTFSRMIGDGTMRVVATCRLPKAEDDHGPGFFHAIALCKGSCGELLGAELCAAFAAVDNAIAAATAAKVAAATAAATASRQRDDDDDDAPTLSPEALAALREVLGR